MRSFTRYPYFIFFILCFLSRGAIGQTRPGSLRGAVSDSISQENLAFVSVIVKDDKNIIITGGSTDLEGNYHLNPIPPGSYTVEFHSVGYTLKVFNEVLIIANTPTVLDVNLGQSANELEVVELFYSAPLIDASKSSMVISPQNISSRAVRDVSSVAGGFSRDEIGITNVRGARGDGRVYFIDGLKMNGSVKIPAAALSETEVITGGLPDNTSSSSLLSKESTESLTFEFVKTIPENDFSGTDFEPLSTFGADVDVASYANVRSILKSGQWPHPDAVRLEEFINYFDYDYPEPAKGAPFSISVDQMTCAWSEGHTLLRIGLQTANVEYGSSPASNLVFLIDVSGSMMSHDKLPLLQNAMKIMVKQLRPIDRVAIVVYASSTGVVLESTPASEKSRILWAINNLTAGGSTAGAAGIELAYKEAVKHFNAEANNRVILATDGDFNVGVSSEEKLIELIEEKRETGVFLSVLGFGNGNYQDRKMEQLADHGNGNYAFIDGLLEARKVLATELGANLHVVAKDTKFQVEFNPHRVKGYRLLGYENRVLESEDFDNDLKDAGDIGSGHTVTAVYELILADQDLDTIWSDKIKLRNQHEVLKDKAFGNELALLKIRYKDPTANESQLEVHPIIESRSTDDDFLFLMAVLEYALLLRDSDYAGTSSFQDAIKLAERSLGVDPHGYRREFVRLCYLAQDLQ